MGGMGSGRCSGGGKSTIDDYRLIDVRDWQREGLIASHKAFTYEWSRGGVVGASIHVRAESDRAILTYRHQRGVHEWKDESLSVWLDWTSCNFGGKRPWFLCPAQGCGRRVAILYCGGIFACRHCYQLAYPSQREAHYDRAARRVNKIRERLGWQQGVLNPKGWQKPKGMHWRTFERLNKEHDAFAATSLAGIAARFNLLGESQGD